LTRDILKNNTRRLLIIAVPIMLSSVISQIQMLIDRIFLGRMNAMYMSAIGNVTAPLWTTMAFCFSITTGASILISQSVGAGEKEKIEEYAAAMIKWNNIIPILLFLFWTFCGRLVYTAMGVSENIMPMCIGYTVYFAPVFLIIGIEGSLTVIMQTSNYTKPMIYYGVIRAGLNIVLDYVLIFGKFGFPQMGIEGAAIATTIAEFVGCIFAGAVGIMNSKLTTRPSLKSVIKAPIMPYLVSAKLGINTALEDFAWNIGNLCMIRILNSINEMAAGIYSIVFGVEVIVLVVIGSIGNGTMTLTGEAKGKNDKEQFSAVVVIAYAISAMVAFVFLIFCAISPQSILGLFTKDANIISSCGLYLLIVCLNLFSRSGNIIVGNGIRGYGDTKWMLMTQVFGSTFIVLVASLFVYVFKLGILGVFLAVLLDEFTRVIINVTRMNNLPSLN